MILKNKRLDVALKAIALLVLTLLLFLPSRNLSYAFSPSEPAEVADPAALATGDLENRYVALQAAPDSAHVLPYFRYGINYYYFPLNGTDGKVFGRTMARLRGSGPVHFEGRLQRFDSVAFSAQVREVYGQMFGEDISHDTWALLEGETPDVYKTVLVAYVPLSFLWLIALYLLVRGIQGKPISPFGVRRPAPRPTASEGR
ncbi:MAG: hypothetical protein M0Z94_00805 [Dehalococcoidales bacterium]|nr:hypothetical protein [Dehalococcoidales bacterium]